MTHFKKYHGIYSELTQRFDTHHSISVSANYGVINYESLIMNRLRLQRSSLKLGQDYDMPEQPAVQERNREADA